MNAYLRTAMSTRPTFTIRPAVPADAARVTILLVAQLREHEIPTDETHVASSVAAMLADPGRGFILVADGAEIIEGVAYVSFATPLEHAGEVAWLEELYVAPAQRNHGIGQALVDAVIEQAGARGCVSVDLEVEADHARAANLYERSGFRRMRRSHWVRPLARWDW
ncbi:Histone acetyltransferase HPA2 [Minicystis rosea]|nr:Histone acetyltransferase HPA2 [Minicystis rosea]